MAKFDIIPPIRGYTIIPVLEFLNGLHYDNLALNYIAALRPSYIRVLKDCDLIPDDSMMWRVNVFLVESFEENQFTIAKIEQEVGIGLNINFENGHALDCELWKRRREYDVTS